MEIGGRKKEWYGTAMVCENGHTITDEVERFPERKAPILPAVRRENSDGLSRVQPGNSRLLLWGVPVDTLYPPGILPQLRQTTSMDKRRDPRLP